jgi:hypothetical protein
VMKEPLKMQPFVSLFLLCVMSFGKENVERAEVLLGKALRNDHSVGWWIAGWLVDTLLFIEEQGIGCKRVE